MMITDDDIQNFGNEQTHNFYGLNDINKVNKLGDWCVIINTEGHNKFWAWRDGLNCVRVRWGKIGTCGEEGNFPNSEIVKRRALQKLRKGYRIPTQQELKQLFGNNFVLWEI